MKKILMLFALAILQIQACDPSPPSADHTGSGLGTRLTAHSLPGGFMQCPSPITLPRDATNAGPQHELAASEWAVLAQVKAVSASDVTYASDQRVCPSVSAVPAPAGKGTVESLIVEFSSENAAVSAFAVGLFGIAPDRLKQFTELQQGPSTGLGPDAYMLMGTGPTPPLAYWRRGLIIAVVVGDSVEAGRLRQLAKALDAGFHG